MLRQRLSWLVVVLFSLGMLAGCGPADPGDTVKDFETAYNHGDIDGMLDCLDPVMTKGIRATLSIAGAFLPIDPHDVLDLIPFLYAYADDDDWGDSKPQVSINILDTKISGDRADVVADLAFTAGGETEIARVCFYMEKHEGRWYIHDVADY